MTGRHAQPVYDRVMARAVPQGDCLVFTGHRNAKGYGQVSQNDRITYAHRVVWEHHHGATGLDVCHHCDNPSCVKIEHLFSGTQADNARDMVQKGRSVAGERAPSARLTAAQVRTIRGALGRKTQAALAREHRVHPGTIGKIARGLSWRGEGDGA